MRPGADGDEVGDGGGAHAARFSQRVPTAPEPDRRAGCRRSVLAGLLVAALLAFPPPHEVAVVPTGAGPCGATAGFGAVWVAADGAGTLVRIDPATLAVVRRIEVGPRPSGLAARRRLGRVRP